MSPLANLDPNCGEKSAGRRRDFAAIDDVCASAGAGALSPGGAEKFLRAAP
jgi:hypothetical protein